MLRHRRPWGNAGRVRRRVRRRVRCAVEGADMVHRLPMYDDGGVGDDAVHLSRAAARSSSMHRPDQPAQDAQRETKQQARARAHHTDEQSATVVALEPQAAQAVGTALLTPPPARPRPHRGEHRGAACGGSIAAGLSDHLLALCGLAGSPGGGAARDDLDDAR